MTWDTSGQSSSDLSPEDKAGTRNKDESSPPVQDCRQHTIAGCLASTGSDLLILLCRLSCLLSLFFSLFLLLRTRFFSSLAAFFLSFSAAGQEGLLILSQEQAADLIAPLAAGVEELRVGLHSFGLTSRRIGGEKAVGVEKLPRVVCCFRECYSRSEARRLVTILPIQMVQVSGQAPNEDGVKSAARVDGNLTSSGLGRLWTSAPANDIHLEDVAC
ncbi:hypothetical protein GWK47_006872 [Chionoecetes opilio]|uniref:Uncharacterized protein n=1 Tax=Chionoecetes opilio TaxID=41210 RepID=A0A8J5CFG0_CHIOP|nr:hypothetical protein GWK47_006872 [Chionoecetes opilio]